MIISVTQEDIVSGIPGDSCFCPIAFAVKRKFPKSRVSVCAYYIKVGVKKYEVPVVAMEFIEDFDRQADVEPFRFTLRKLPQRQDMG